MINFVKCLPFPVLGVACCLLTTSCVHDDYYAPRPHYVAPAPAPRHTPRPQPRPQQPRIQPRADHRPNQAPRANVNRDRAPMMNRNNVAPQQNNALRARSMENVRRPEPQNARPAPQANRNANNNRPHPNRPQKPNSED